MKKAIYIFLVLTLLFSFSFGVLANDTSLSNGEVQYFSSNDSEFGIVVINADPHPEPVGE